MRPGEVDKLARMRDRLNIGLVGKTVQNHRYAFDAWLRFCRQSGLETWRECSLAVAVGWIGWLRKRGLKDWAVRSAAVFPLRCVELLQQLEPGSVSPSFAIPYAQLPVFRPGYRGAVLSEGRLREIMGRCVREIESATNLTRPGLIPFIVLFHIRTGMNVDSVLGLRRDCVVSHGQGHWIYWEKRRSAGCMRDYYGPMRWGPVEIVHALCALHGNRLVFSVPSGRDAPLSHIHDDVRRWCRRQGLREFTLSEIRPAMATLIYRESNGNAVEVQRFLHHRSLSTTMAYLSENITRPINEALLAKAQDAMLDRWGVPKDGGP